MLLLRAGDFGPDEILRTTLSALVTDDGQPVVLIPGATILAMVDDHPDRVYVLCVDVDTDTLNLAIAGPSS